jgi:PKD repeat protein
VEAQRIRHLLMAFLALTLAELSNLAQAETLFYESRIFARETGAPQVVTDSFTMEDVAGDFTLVVANGDMATGDDRVSSAVVTLNGVEIVGANDFNKKIGVIERPVTLLPTNSLTVTVKGKPGTYLKVSVVGELWNRRPIAAAGADSNTVIALPVVLDGSASFDPDGDIITFHWTLLSAPAGSDSAMADASRPDPRFTPDVAGEYGFELIAHDGQVDSEPDTVTVTAFDNVAPPNARAGNDQHVLTGAPVLLDGSQSTDPNDLPLSFAWSFFDVPSGSTVTNESIALSDNTAHAQFVPDVSGTYLVRLGVDNGALYASDSLQVFASEANVPPTSDAGPDEAVRVGEVVTLDGSGSLDPDGGQQALSYSWSLQARPSGSLVSNADIADSDQPLAHFTPDVEGAYVARLQVDDGEFQDGDNTLAVADDTAPSLAITAPEDGAIVDSSQPTITAEFDDEGSGIAIDSFQLLVNGTDVTADAVVNERTASYSPQFDLPGGDNEVTARVSDKAGNSAEATNHFSISVFRAIADCGPTLGTAPHRVTYRSRGEFTGGSIVRYRWDLNGDGTYDTNDSVPRDYTYTFNSPGTYNAVLEVQNNLGAIATDVCTITVQRQPPTATATASPSNGPVPLEITLICQGQSKNGAIVLWEWDFNGNGTYDYSSDANGTVTHTYETVGDFAARCRVTDAAGLTGISGEINTTVRPRPAGSPSVTATASPTAGAAALTVNFDASVITNATIVLYQWDFDGDATYDYSSATSAAVSHTYSAGGTFAATVQVTDNAGLTSLDSIAIAVDVSASLSIPDDTFLPGAGETATIRTVLTGTVQVHVRIRDRRGVDVRTLVDETRAAGTYNDAWDGRNDAGELLPDGDYYAILEYQDAGGTHQVDLTYSTGGYRYSPTRSRLTSRFSPYENDPLPITFTVPSSQGASEVLAFVGLYRTDTRVVTLLDREPFGVGTYTIYWDGLLPDGSFAVPPPGDTFLFGIWGYRLPDNAIYLSSAPTISGFSVGPTQYSPARDGSRPLRITFDLNKDADMVLSVQNLTTGRVVFADRFLGFTAGASKVLEWDGLDGEGYLPDKGQYRLALTAIDASGSTSLTRYMLLRVFY